VIVLETERLTLRQLTVADAPFALELLNEPSFIQNIGDRGVRNLDDARGYLLNGPIESYRRHGFGLNRVDIKDTATPIGMCGLLKRAALDNVDIGYAFFPRYWSQGYAFESASAMLRFGKDTLGIERIVAVVSPGNDSSIRLLKKIGLKFERMVRLLPEEQEIKLFAP